MGVCVCVCVRACVLLLLLYIMHENAACSWRYSVVCVAVEHNSKLAGHTGLVVSTPIRLQCERTQV